MSSNTVPVDSYQYYRIINAEDTTLSLSSGINQDAQGQLNMTEKQTYSSSENWQLYLQSGRYFIRNRDYGSNWQLGLTNNSFVPALLTPQSGGLGQQWIITPWSDGTYRLTNGLLGNNSMLTLATGNTLPAMDTSSTGGHWTFEMNRSAGNVTADMLLDVEGFVTETSSSATSTPPSTPITSLSSTPTSIPTTSLSSTTTSTPTTSLSSGAIAGIAVGGVAVLLLVAVALFVIRRNHHQKKKVDSNLEPQFPTQTPYSTKQPYTPVYNQQVYEAPHPVPVELDGLDTRGK